MGNAELDKDMKKKTKILTYLKKVLSTGDAKSSIIKQKTKVNEDTVIFMKKWSVLDEKLVFKLNSKMMQAVLSPDQELLLKYDTGIAMYFTKTDPLIKMILPEAIKSMIFNNTTSLKRKIETVHNLL